MKTTTPPKPKKKVKTLSREEVITARERLHELNQEMEERKEEQLAIRNYLADHFHEAESGAKTFKVDDVKFTITRVMNHSISRDEAARCQQERPDLYATCLRFKPEVREGELKKNPEFADFVTSKPGPPQVSFA